MYFRCDEQSIISHYAQRIAFSLAPVIFPFFSTPDIMLLSIHRCCERLQCRSSRDNWISLLFKFLWYPCISHSGRLWYSKRSIEAGIKASTFKNCHVYGRSHWRSNALDCNRSCLQGKDLPSRLDPEPYQLNRIWSIHCYRTHCK